MVQVRLIVTGRVQGVGFRWHVLREAQALDLTGAVWNRPDGSVEIQAEGERSRLEEFIEAVRPGPPSAEVSRVHVFWSEGPQQYDRFLVGRMS